MGSLHETIAEKYLGDKTVYDDKSLSCSTINSIANVGFCALKGSFQIDKAG